ncbi:MAG: IS5 family transposase [Spirosomataceae bacterium]
MLSKNTIEKWIIPHLSVGSRGFEPKVPLVELVEAILYRLKTGCQWRELPTQKFFSGTILSWNSVYYHFNKWNRAGCWRKIFVNLLRENRQYLDLSRLALDGSHTASKNGGEAVSYQGRKSCKTTNALFITDNQGIVLSMSTPQAGNHHDLYEINTFFNELCDMLKEVGIILDGLFLNADGGFDSKELKEACSKEGIIANIKPNSRNKQADTPSQTGVNIFDEELYKGRYVIERTNAWIDGFKALLIRFEFLVQNWICLHFMAFSVILLRKISTKNKV